MFVRSFIIYILAGFCIFKKLEKFSFSGYCNVGFFFDDDVDIRLIVFTFLDFVH